MKVKTNNNIELTLASTPFKKGGEGSIYKILSPSNYQSSCVKIYKDFEAPTPKMNSYVRRCEEKIRFIVDNPPTQLASTNFSLAWCKELIYDSKGKFLGFVMPLIFPNEKTNDLYRLLEVTLHPKIRDDANWEKFKNTNSNYFINRLKLCANISKAIYTIHSSGNFVLLDFKPQNIIVTNTGKIAICDIDSMQISSNGRVIHHSEAITPEYAPPESISFRKGVSSHDVSWDKFSIAITYYHLLFGLNPFSNANFKQPYHNASLPPNKIENALFVFGEKAKTHLIKKDPLHENFKGLPIKLQRLFQTALDNGCSNPQLRPSAEDWGKAFTSAAKNLESRKLIKKAVQKQSVSPIIPGSTGKKDDSNFWIWFFIIVAIIVIINFASISNSSITNVQTETPNTSVNQVADKVNASPYGIGYGNIVVYKTCNNCEQMEVYIDDYYVGTLNDYYEEGKEPLDKTSSATVTQNVLAGLHKVKVKDKTGYTFFKEVTVNENICEKVKFDKTNSFGEGNGQLTIYNTYNYSNIRVYVDDNYVGTFTKYIEDNYIPSCGEMGDAEILTTLSKGYHTITASDYDNNSWSGSQYVTEAVCSVCKLENFKKANPYSENNGKISIWTNVGEEFDIYLNNNYQGRVTEFFTSGQPNCGQDGTLSVDLPAGQYSFLAKGSSNNWTGTLTVYKGECNLFKINVN